jgi:hypothetical protein
VDNPVGGDGVKESGIALIVAVINMLSAILVAIITTYGKGKGT